MKWTVLFGFLLGLFALQSSAQADFIRHVYNKSDHAVNFTSYYGPQIVSSININAGETYEFHTRFDVGNYGYNLDTLSIDGRQFNMRYHNDYCRLLHDGRTDPLVLNEPAGCDIIVINP